MRSEATIRQEIARLHEELKETASEGLIEFGCCAVARTMSVMLSVGCTSIEYERRWKIIMGDMLESVANGKRFYPARDSIAPGEWMMFSAITQGFVKPSKGWKTAVLKSVE